MIASFSAAILVYRGQRRAEMAAEDRKLYAAAISTLVQWSEMPFRIARRFDDSVETRQRITQEFHELQIEISKHDAWISLRDRELGKAFRAATATVKRRVRPMIEEAWSKDAQGIGSLGGQLQTTVRDDIDTFCRDVATRSASRWWQL